MMDTEALWQAVAAYGNARWRDVKYEQDAADHLSEIKAILSEADAERQELLATNEKLVDEVADLKSAVQIYLGVVQERNRLESENAELKSKLTEKAYLLRGCYAADHKQKQRIEELTAERDALKAELEGRYQSIIEMGNMLTEIVNLIRGEPEEGTSHSTHDAVELVRGLAMHNDLYATAVELEVAKLKAENERLLAANRDCIAHYEDARAELERIKALPPAAWCLGNPSCADSSNVFLAHDFTPDGEHEDEWTALYALGSKT